MIFNHFIAVLSALILSVKYGRLLKIKRKEWKRYLKKSVSLSLCYAGFAELGKLREAWMSGKAAFLCCAYDIVTDWRNFDQNERAIFERILCVVTRQPEIQTLAIKLYEKELSNQLENDGLDRGSVALRFVLKMMRCEKAREIVWSDLDELGQLLQIVDDVLDYEEDLAYGDTNCLTSEKKNFYLNQLLLKLNESETQKIFGNKNSVITKVIKKAREKAKQLLADEIAVQDNFKSIHLVNIN